VALAFACALETLAVSTFSLDTEEFPSYEDENRVLQAQLKAQQDENRVLQAQLNAAHGQALSLIHPSACSHQGVASTAMAAMAERCPFRTETPVLGDTELDVSALSETCKNGLCIPQGPGCKLGGTSHCYARYTNMKCESAAESYTTKDAAILKCNKDTKCTGIHLNGGNGTDWSEWRFCKNARQDWDTEKSGFHIFAKQGPLNEAKCAGSVQDHRQVTGVLDCNEGLNKNNQEQTGADCLDNLSNGQVFASYLSGPRCREFSHDAAIGRVVQVINKRNFHGGSNARFTNQTRDGWQGVMTKLVVAHPNMASVNIGAIALKRVRCSDLKCSVFRTGYCIKVNYWNKFASNLEREANTTELKKFAKHVEIHAFQNRGKHYAELKSGYKCDENNQKLVDAWLTMV